MLRLTERYYFDCIRLQILHSGNRGTSLQSWQWLMIGLCQISNLSAPQGALPVEEALVVCAFQKSLVSKASTYLSSTLAYVLPSPAGSHQRDRLQCSFVSTINFSTVDPPCMVLEDQALHKESLGMAASRWGNWPSRYRTGQPFLLALKERTGSPLIWNSGTALTPTLLCHPSGVHPKPRKPSFRQREPTETART